MKRLVLLFCLLLLPPVLRAQPPRTARDDYRRAVAGYSRLLKMAAARTESAAETLGQVRTGRLPRLDATGDFSLSARRYGENERWTFSLLPQLVQTLYGGGSVRAAVEQAEQGYDIALCDEEFAAFEVRYAADYAYWSLSAAELYAEAMRRYVAIIRSLGEVVRRRFDEGLIARGDVLMIEARLSEAEYERVAAEQRCEVALHNFNVLRGVSGNLAVELAQGIRDSLPMPARAQVAQVLARRADFAAARLRAEQAGTAVRSVRAHYNPQVDVGVGASWRPDTPNRTGATTLDGTAFVRLSVPVFHWGERRRAVGAAQAERLRTEWEAAQLHDEILLEELNGWTALVQSRAQIDASEASLRIAGENLEISTYSYGEGLATILDVLQAQLSWIQLYSNAIRAHYNYAVAVSDYERITAR